jgi:hypothetical protein
MPTPTEWRLTKRAPQWRVLCTRLKTFPFIVPVFVSVSYLPKQADQSLQSKSDWKLWRENIASGSKIWNGLRTLRLHLHPRIAIMTHDPSTLRINLKKWINFTPSGMATHSRRSNQLPLHRRALYEAADEQRELVATGCSTS